MDEEKKDKIIWYEITLDAVPQNDLSIKYYVNIDRFTKYSDPFGNIRYCIDPHVGKYANENYWEIDHNKRKTIVISDTILDYDEALRLEEDLVLMLHSCDSKKGFNVRKE